MTNSTRGAIIITVESLKLNGLRKCRNWQTSKTKDLVVVTLCGFKSHLPHQRIWTLYKNSYGLRKCRNWQTSKIQVLVSVTLVRVQVPSSAWLRPLVYRGFFISACSGLRRGLPAGCYAEFHPGIRSKETVPADTRERPEAADSQPSQPSPRSCRRRNCSGFHALRLRAGVHQRREIP